MKKITLKDIILTILFAMALLLLFGFGLDREQARQDWLRTGGATGCIFETNCKHYNNL